MIIHGGPTGTDRPTLLDARYYPADLWTARGALVLKVNYRGSAGYGEKFRTLNYRNLGVGDTWDVLSGVDHLIKKGWVYSTKMAAMATAMPARRIPSSARAWLPSQAYADQVHHSRASSSSPWTTPWALCSWAM